MKVTRNSGRRRTGRAKLAGTSDRNGGDAGKKDGHGQASADAGAVRRDEDLSGARSAGRTIPPVMKSMRTATRSVVPRARKRSLRTCSAEMSPIRSAMAASETPSTRIQSRSSMSGDLPEAVLLADVVAKVLVSLLAVLPGHKGLATLERLTNLLHDRSDEDTESSELLGAVALALMRHEM